MSPLTLRDARVAACARGSMPSVVSPCRRRNRVLPTVFLLALSGIAMATDYYVNGTAGNNTYDGLAQTWDGVHGPKQTIQAAINTASSGDTITVAQGTYAAAITFGGRNLTLRSSAPTNWAVVCATVISAPSGTTAVTFNSGETASAVLTGFTVTSSSGRGISCSGASPVIRSCRITGNSSYAGGGVYLSGSSATIRNCLIYGNFTGMSGAGGVYTQSGSPTIENCTIAGNSCGAGGALAGGVGVSTGSATLRNCILWANTRNGTTEQGYISTGASAAVSYSCIQAGQGGFTGTVTWGSGILASDPLFADSANGDYHLKSLYGRWNGTAWVTDTQSSPGIDAGCPTDDYSNEPAGNGGRVNLGTFGNTPEASLSSAPGPQFVTSGTAISVPEGGTAQLTLCLSQAPAANVTAALTLDTGADADLSISSSLSLSFTPTTWATPQTVSLAAAEDADADNGTATLRFAATGLPDKTVALAEADNDFRLTVTADAGGTATPAGTTVRVAGAVVSIEATPATDVQFDAWAGDTATVANPAAAQTTVTVNANTALQATFILPFLTYYVDGTAGSNSHDGFAQTWDGVHGPKQTVQAAIDAAYSDTAHSGEVIIVMPGTYAESVNFRGLNITLTSVDPDDLAVVAGTTLSAPSGTTAVTFNSGETAASVLTGLTVTSSSGRGISCTSASPTIHSCRITGNSSSSGGGLYLSGSSAAIRNCLIYGNFTGMSGAGGVYTQSGSPTIENCTIAGNSCGGGGALAGGIGVSTGSATVRNCILWGNTRNGTAEQGRISTGASATVSYSCIQNGQSGFAGTVTWGNGILASDPLFANSAGGDYRLKSVFGRWNGTAWVTDAQSSPGIDAGCPTDDYSNEPPGNGLRVNLGFDGNTPFASLSAAANPQFVLTPSAVTVPEGGTAAFTVTLSQAPTGTVAVMVSVASGDPDISVASGASFNLNTTNWSTGQSVTLSAAEDADTQDGTAVIAVQASGVTSAQLTATEADDDVTLTVTGGTPAGTTVHESGSVVTVTATPPAHYQFASWTGNIPTGQQTQSPTNLTLTADTSITAQFTVMQYTVTATANHGTVAGAGAHDYNTQAQLTVTPATGYHFTNWTGDVPTGHTTDNPLTVTVTGNLTLAAVCIANQPALVVSTTDLTVPEGGSAGFTVALNLCPSAAVSVTAAMQAQGDADLTILSGSTRTFTSANWDVPQSITVAAAEDDADVTNGTRTVSVSAAGMADVSVLCQEADDDVLLTITGGTPAGTTIHESGSVVTITGIPTAHHHFTQWTGNTGALANPLAQTTQATLTADTTLVAGQAIDRHTLTLVSAHGSPQGAGEYDYGTTVDWSVASPVAGGAGERFVAAQTTGQVQMDQNRTVEVAWTTQYLLSAAAGEHGSAEPAAQWYGAGATATASATASLGWHFAGWTGDVPSANQPDNPVTLTMSQARSVTAAFARNTTTYWAALKTGTSWSANWPARTDSAWRETAVAVGGGWQADLSAHVAAGQSGFAIDTVAVADRSGTAIAADGFESGTTGQPPGGWTFNPTWGDLGTLVVTEARAAAGTKSLVLAGSTTDQGIFLPATAAAGDIRLSLALYLPSTLPSSATLLSLWYRGVCVTLRTAATGTPELGLGLDVAAPAVCLNQPLTTDAWNTLTLFVQTVVDTDADGMGDAWENAVFGDLSRDGSGDYDADGLSDLLEWQCGTNPAVASPTVVLVPPVQTEVTEGAGTVTCQLQLSQAASVPVIASVSFTGTTTLGTDYTTTCGTQIVFALGQTVITIPLTILTDAVWDPAETIILSLTAVSGACPGSPAQVTITIREVDDDGDGMDDQWEITHFGSAAATPGADPDGDGLTNLAEFQHESNPTDADTNGDGLADGAAVAWGVEPARPVTLIAITAPASGKVLP